MYEYISQETATAVCKWAPSHFHLFSQNISGDLVLYAHTVPAIISVIFGVAVFIKNRSNIMGRLLLILGLLFLSWSLVDLSLYATESMFVTMGMWSWTSYLDPLLMIVAFLIMFSAVFNKMPNGKVFGLIGLFLLPVIIFGPTNTNVAYFDLQNCSREVGEGWLVSYVYGLDILILIATVAISIYGIFKSNVWAKRYQLIRILIGIAGFMFLFCFGNIIGSMTSVWDIANYSMFAMPVFIAFLGYNILNNQQFHGRMIVVYGLILIQWLLVSSIIFVESNRLSDVIAGVVLVFSVVLNLFLVRLLNRANYHRREVENLLQLITHQIKGFLAKSKSIFALALEGEFGELSNSLKRVMQEGLRSDTKGVNFIESLLGVVRVRQGTAIYSSEKCDVTAILREVIEDMHVNLDAKGLALAVALPPVGHCIVMGDPFYLRQAIKNVFDNAIIYTNSGTVFVTGECLGDKVQIVISDTGVGITEEDMRVLFTEGGHGKNSRKLNIESTGYGLYITKHVIDAHNGIIKVQSEGAGKGTTVTVELPLI